MWNFHVAVRTCILHMLLQTAYNNCLTAYCVFLWRSFRNADRTVQNSVCSCATFGRIQKENVCDIPCYTVCIKIQQIINDDFILRLEVCKHVSLKYMAVLCFFSCDVWSLPLGRWPILYECVIYHLKLRAQFTSDLPLGFPTWFLSPETSSHYFYWDTRLN